MKIDITQYYPQALPADEQVELAEEISKLFNWFQPDSDSAAILQMIARDETSIVLVARSGGELLGFLVARTLLVGEVNILYGSGLLIDPKHWSSGVGAELIRAVTSSTSHFDYLVAKTQNPAIYHLLKKLVGEDIYPREGVSNPSEIVEIARLVCGDTVNEDLVITGTFHNLRDDRDYLYLKENSTTRFFAKTLLNPNDGFFVVIKLK